MQRGRDDMRHEITASVGLVNALDDSTFLCNSVSANVTRPLLKRSLGRIVQTHQRISDDLCKRTAAAGRHISSKATVLQRWRVVWLRWTVCSSWDIELACATWAEKREERLLRRFRGALQQAGDPETRGCLLRYSHELERVRTEIECLVPLIEFEANASLLGRHTGIRTPTPLVMRRPSAYGNGRLAARRLRLEDRVHEPKP